MVCTTLASAQQQLAQRRAGGSTAKRERQADRKPERQRRDADRDMAAEIGRQARERFGDLRVARAFAQPLRQARAAARPGGAASAISSRT